MLTEQSIPPEVDDLDPAPFRPAPAQAAADRISSQAGLASIREGLTHAEWMADRLRMAEAAGQIVKLTGRRSISSPGGDAA